MRRHFNRGLPGGFIPLQFISWRMTWNCSAALATRKSFGFMKNPSNLSWIGRFGGSKTYTAHSHVSSYADPSIVIEFNASHLLTIKRNGMRKRHLLIYTLRCWWRTVVLLYCVHVYFHSMSLCLLRESPSVDSLERKKGHKYNLHWIQCMAIANVTTAAVRSINASNDKLKCVPSSSDCVKRNWRTNGGDEKC